MDYLRHEQTRLGLESSILYYDFPAYVDYEAETNRPDILLLIPTIGFIAIRFVDEASLRFRPDAYTSTDAELNDFCSNLYARLLRSKGLRKDRTSSLIDVFPVIFDTANANVSSEMDSDVCGSYEQFEKLLSAKTMAPFALEIISEARSVVEGAKALTRTNKRIIADPDKQPLAVALAELEAEIANFDQKQRHIALVDVGGPARIRGLAGSGKTIILAMKAAHLHLNNPSAKILVTFFTRSLRATLKALVSKFYRHYSEKDPDWSVIHIRHGWGGASLPGVYSDASRRVGRAPLRLPEGQRIAKVGESAFSAVCRELIEGKEVAAFYDHILIDEGQDFPASFYELCFFLAKGARDRKSIVWAYDELQDIMNVKIRQPEELFGIDSDGEPRISLDRSAAHVPPGATNDATLEKCYRNQREVLVCAHALGFGVYGTIVQLLESAEHWRDVGYEVLTGPLIEGMPVRVERPQRNSPLEIQDTVAPVISEFIASSIDAEIDWMLREVEKFLEGGLSPEEIVVISLDDRHAKNYLSRIAEGLAARGIASNNVIADPYNEPPFMIPGKVTLSTVYRAKGNEAAAVFAVGIDAVETRSRDGRNKIFTAFTRSKAWLRVSGIGEPATRIFGELRKARELCPQIQFKMPNLREIETIQRGFSLKQARAKAAREEFIRKLKSAGYSDAEIDEELAQGLLGSKGD